jgi:hypothetical protein
MSCAPYIYFAILSRDEISRHALAQVLVGTLGQRWWMIVLHWRIARNIATRG